MSVQARGRRSNLCTELDWCQVQIETGGFRRHVAGEQGDIFKGNVPDATIGRSLAKSDWLLHAPSSGCLAVSLQAKPLAQISVGVTQT